MGLFSDMKVLYHLALKPVRGKSHAERMENFYGGQADAYDDFRKRLLKGREDLLESVHPADDGGVWVDMGGGTGSNVALLDDRVKDFKKIYVVDLASSLLEVAQKRFDEKGWSNVKPIEADATKFKPEEGFADIVTFSYSLTMIPDWFAAMENAVRILKPGGKIAVVDFFVSRKYPADGRARHSWFTRSFWPVWFAGDNVFPSPDHVPFLHHYFEPNRYEERKCKIPYMPLLRMPYYLFVGTKKAEGMVVPSISIADGLPETGADGGED
ncbi:class I SAM-dependent methyltransferase [Mariniblastus sp.]|jgi:S-adenosylmethionine-diacylgycerolhomoserine-N-methlytransferase|nr:class I SAM-dependent methyltransferase [Mariniblastus sp.]MDB4671401.1 class I SAM-dependent methyltransferase [Pirellulaceae bacterium]MDB4757126.1 class I SAM-dependent methyltransferase [Mariniblastus sp.]